MKCVKLKEQEDRKLKTCVCVCVLSHQRYSTDLDEEVSFLQISVLQLVRFVRVVQGSDQLAQL